MTLDNRNIKILVIDDDVDIQENLQRLLLRKGYNVALASNGKEGLKELKNFEPDIIILDIIMPIMDGWEFQQLKDMDPIYSNIPLFVFCAGDKDTSKPPRIRAHRFLSKPIEFDDILDAIQQHTYSESHLSYK